MGKKHPCYGKSMSTNFPDFAHTVGFVAFSHTAGNLWGNPCISHLMALVNFLLFPFCSVYNLTEHSEVLFLKLKFTTLRHDT